LSYERQWKSFDTAPKDGTEVLFWVSSEKGFQDCVASFYYVTKEHSTMMNKLAREDIWPTEGWYWSETEEPLKRPDLIRGWKEYPEPPKQFSTNEDKVK
jgi:hypothetical protein